MSDTSIRISTGELRILINDDPKRVVVFNPADIIFAEKFYGLIGAFETKQVEYEKRLAENEAEFSGKDKYGLPASMPENLALLHEICDFMRAKIDEVFGASTSQTAFGNAMTMDMLKQFFEGLVPLFESVREPKIAQYQTQEFGDRARARKKAKDKNVNKK